jgi:hypothetical protein
MPTSQQVESAYEVISRCIKNVKDGDINENAEFTLQLLNEALFFIKANKDLLLSKN